MNISIIVGLIITALICGLAGVISIFKPKYAGIELSLKKSNKFFAIKCIEPTNNYYLRYIVIIGVGLSISSLLLLVVTVVYVLKPSILLFK